MRYQVKFLAILCIVTLLYGCDSNKFQIVAGSDGALYRFNKKTGAVFMIMKDNSLVQLTEPQKSDIMKERRAPDLDKPVSWKESKFANKDLKAKFEMIWREESLCYKFSVYPYKSLEKVFAKKKQDYVYSMMMPGFTVELTDKNGFPIKEIKINLWSMIKVDGDDGEPKELVLNSQVDCTRQSYRSIEGCAIKWRLESEVMDDVADDAIKSSPKTK
jgi:hypothetical protein